MKLENWSIRVSDNPYLAPELQTPRLAGIVFGHPNFQDGDSIVTSPIASFDGMRVITKSGSHYELGKVNPDYEAQYPDAKNRLIKSLGGEKCCICGKSLVDVPDGWAEKQVCSGRCWGELYGEP